MKKNYFYLVALVALPVFCFSSCGEEDEKFTEIEVTKEVQRISFEQVTLNAGGYENNFPEGLILSDVDFYNINEIDPVYFYSYWSGFAVSNNTDQITNDYTNEYSVFANSGANNSEKFGVIYDGYYEGASYDKTSCEFTASQEFKFKNLWINNSTWAALYMQDSFTDSDYFRLVIKGFDSNGNPTGQPVKFDLAKGKSIVKNWTLLDLSQLGKVHKLEFSFESSDEWVPKYACIDDIIYYVD